MLKRIIHLGSILFIISFCVSLLLAAGNALTEERIAANAALAAEVARAEVLPEGESFKEITPQIYEATSSDATVGWCVNTSVNGFGGEISLMVGIRADGTIGGVRVLSASETAGLGSNASGEWNRQFDGKTEGVSVVKKSPGENEISAITGATVTSKAVTDGVNHAFSLLAEEGLLKGGVN